MQMRSRSARRPWGRSMGGWLPWVALLMVTSGFAPYLSPSPTGPAPPTTHSAHAGTAAAPRLFVHPPGLGRGPLSPAAGPAYYEVWYTQEGATLAQFNGTGSQTGVKSLSVDIPLVNSPYPIGYELNGLTNRGDWYQIVVGVNWAGCPGLDMITEVWDNLGGSGPVGCSGSPTMSIGDLVRLGLNFSASAGICMDLTDVTRSSGQILCQHPPDSGASQFITLQTTANTNGYFTGPMTEIANTSATSCPDYTHMPLVNYEWSSAFGVSEYVPWSDEFELTTGTFCYSNSGGVTGFLPTDPTTDYADMASSPYGPHYVAGQQFSFVNAAYGFRIQTDPVPLTGVSLSVSATTIPLNANVTLTALVAGGASPYTALWALNGSLFTNGSLVMNWTGTHGGAYHFTAYGVDHHLDVIGPSAPVTVLVNGPLALSDISASSATGNADVGQSITFLVTASGGIPPYTYSWSGLPSECPAGNTPSVGCVPASPGIYSLQVTVSDTNGSVLQTSVRGFTVSAAPSPSLLASVSRLDVGQTLALVANVAGGAGGLSYSWSGLPAPCLSVNAPSVSCAVALPGLSTASVSVTDANGASAATPGTAILVFAAPSVTLQVDHAIIDAGVALTFTVAPTGGSGGYLVSWSGLPPGCPGSNVVLLVCSASMGGTYAVSVNLTDSVGGTASAGPLVVFAYPPLNLTVVGPSRIVVGGELNASLNISGGASHVSISWANLPDGCLPTSASVLVCQPTTAGEYNITVTVTDSGGGSSQTTYHLVVVYPPASTPPAGPMISLLALGLGAILIVVIAIGAWAATRRRRA